ncbi:glycosyltransferase [Cryobacterium sp. TMT2-14]|uniref:glycosyltransferase n=1 Tax=Cryobacterium sp. TMT2-14 TaxID=1259245 RepID=UPI00141A765B|nr:glycosyltransferase [Cryobacterium sp. TMT2-14]
MTDHEVRGLSILTASFNPGKYLLSAVTSVLPQLDEFSEICLQDANSTDDSLRSLVSIRDPKLKVICAPDDGQSDGLNKALRRARGEWILWMNADDVVLPGAIREFERAIKGLDGDVNVIYGSYSRIDADGREIFRLHPGVMTFETLAFGRRRPWSGATFVKKAWLEEIGGFNNEYHFCMDFELFLRLWQNPRTVAFRLPESVPIGALRIHGGTKTASFGWSFVRELRRARKHHLVSRFQNAFAVIASAVDVAIQLSTPIRESKIYRIVRGRERGPQFG